MSSPKASKQRRSAHGAFRDFVSHHKFGYISILVLTLVLTTQRVVVPHLYGKIVNHLNEKEIDKASAMFTALNLAWIFYQFILGGLSWIETVKMPQLYNFLKEWFLRTTTDSGLVEVDVGGMLNKLMRFPAALGDYYDIIRDFVFYNLFTIVFIAGYLGRVHWSLGTLFFAMIVITFVVGTHFKKTCTGLNEKGEVLVDESNDSLEDVLANLPAIIGADSREHEYQHIRKVMNNVREAQAKASRCQLPYRITFVILACLSLVVMNYMSLRLLKEGTIDIATSVSVFIISYSSLSVMMQMYTGLRDFLSTLGKLRLIDKFLGNLPAGDVITVRNTAERPPRIRMRDVYLDFLQKISPVSLDIPSGSRTAIQGSIGSGKSSIALVIAGLLKQSRGDVMLDERVVQQGELRGAVYYVSQNPTLFRRTLWQNIIYGNEKEDLKPDDVLSILDMAGLQEIHERFKNNLYRNAGRRGTRFSGGERQIVWLLRAYLSPQKIIILDEPTSSLDKNSRNNVETLIKFIGRGKTIIIITHEQELLAGWFTQIIRF